MLHGSRVGVSIVAVATLVGAGIIATTGTANAAAPDCPNNSVCLWNGPNFTGPMIFEEDASTMHDTGYLYSSKWLEGGAAAISSDNSSLGRFCTYDGYGNLTDVLDAGTSGNLANTDVYSVQQC